MSTVASVLDTVRSSGLLEPRMRVLAMLSGGADSVCLVHSLDQLLGPGGVTALHVNHGIRPSAGDDERFCVELCERLGIPLRVERLDLAWGATSRMPHAGGDMRPPSAFGPPSGWIASPPATRPPTRWRRFCTGSPPRPAAGRCWGCAAATGS